MLCKSEDVPYEMLSSACSFQEEVCLSDNLSVSRNKTQTQKKQCQMH